MTWRNRGVGISPTQDVILRGPNPIVCNRVIGHVVTSKCQIHIPGHLSPLTTSIAVTVEVVVLPHVVVVLRENSRCEVIELSWNIDVVENEILQRGAALIDTIHKGHKIGIRFIGAVLLLHPAGPAGSAIKQLVERAIVIDPLFTSKQPLVHLLGKGCHAIKGPILLHPHQKTHRTRRTGEIV